MDHAVHETRRALGFVKREMQHLKVVEQGAADVEDHTLAGIVEQVVVSVAHEIAHAFEDEKGRHNACEERHIPSGNRLIDDELHEKRRHRCNRYRDQVANSGDAEQALVAADIAPKPGGHRLRTITHRE